MEDGSIFFVLFAMLIAIPFYAFAFYIYYRLIQKTGYSGCFGLIILMIPLVNIAAILYAAFSEWPIEKELRELKESKRALEMPEKNADSGLIEKN